MTTEDGLSPACRIFRKEVKADLYSLITDFWPDLLSDEAMTVAVDRSVRQLIEDLMTYRKMKDAKEDLGSVTGAEIPYQDATTELGGSNQDTTTEDDPNGE